MNARCFIQPVFGSKQDPRVQNTDQGRQVKEVNMLFWQLMSCENEVLNLGAVTFSDWRIAALSNSKITILRSPDTGSGGGGWWLWKLSSVKICQGWVGVGRWRGTHNSSPNRLQTETYLEKVAARCWWLMLKETRVCFPAALTIVDQWPWAELIFILQSHQLEAVWPTYHNKTDFNPS